MCGWVEMNELFVIGCMRKAIHNHDADDDDDDFGKQDSFEQNQFHD